MKKLTVLFLLVFNVLVVKSQTNSISHFQFGIKLGSGMQTVTGCPLNHIPRLAFMGGFWFQLKMRKNWSLQTEVGNIGKGTGLGVRQSTYGDYWLNLYYFEMPLLLQYHKKNTYVEFGPSVAVLINTGEYVYTGALLYQPDQYPFYKKDLSFQLGAAYAFHEKWRIGIRINHALLPVRKQLPGTSHAFYTRGVMLVLSRQFNLHGDKKNQSKTD